MIVFKDGILEYDINHLKADKTLDYDGIIERYKTLSTRLFYNIVSSPKCGYENKLGKDRISKTFKDLTAEERFKNILVSGELIGNPKGYYINKFNKELEPVQIEQTKSVSFTFAEIDEIPRHFEARKSGFGICFFHDFLQNNGIRPVSYINDNDEDTNERIIFNSPHLIEVCSRNYDMKWEREWRIKGNLKFNPNDVAFLIVPIDKYDEILDWCNSTDNVNGYGLEIPIVTELNYTSYVEHLLYFPKMDNGWNQIAVFRSRNDNGFKIDPDDLPKLTEVEKKQFMNENHSDLFALAKNTIHELYEYRYVKYYIDFLNNLKKDIKSKTIFKNFEENKNEAFLSNSDLVNGLYTELVKFLRDRNRLNWF